MCCRWLPLPSCAPASCPRRRLEPQGSMSWSWRTWGTSRCRPASRPSLPTTVTSFELTLRCFKQLPAPGLGPRSGSVPGDDGAGERPTGDSRCCSRPATQRPSSSKVSSPNRAARHRGQSNWWQSWPLLCSARCGATRSTNGSGVSRRSSRYSTTLDRRPSVLTVHACSWPSRGPTFRRERLPTGSRVSSTTGTIVARSTWTWPPSERPALKGRCRSSPPGTH